MSDNSNITEFNSETEKAFQTAWHSAKGGDGNWDGFLSSYGAVPLTSEERKMLLDSEMKIVKGAFPIELRRIFEKIVEKYSSKNDPQLNNVIANFNIEAKVKEYYQKIKPFSGMNDIFSNASATQNKYSEGLKSEKQHTIKCKNCGAPRLEEMQYDNCLFCGSALFETKS